MPTLHDVLRRPLSTEKSSLLKESETKVVLEVASWATKGQIAVAAKQFFDVDVLGVRTMVVRGKTKRVGKRMGRRSNWKKAVLKLGSMADADVFGALAPLPAEAQKE